MTNNIKQLYNEITELNEKIAEAKRRLASLDTRMTCYKLIAVNWKYETGKKRPVDYIEISIPQEVDYLSGKAEEHLRYLDEIRSKINKIDTYIDSYPNIDDMSEEEKISFQLFLKDVIETALIGDNGSYLCTNIIGQYIRKVNLIERSINWEKTKNASGKGLTVDFFGDTYVYKPRYLKRFLRRIFDEDNNEFDYSSPSQIKEFNNLQVLFLYSITDEEAIKEYLRRAKQNYAMLYEREKNSAEFERINSQLEAITKIYKERLSNQKYAQQLHNLIDALTVMYEEKMKLFLGIENDNISISSQNKGGSFAKK